MHRRLKSSIDEELKQLDSQIRSLAAREADLQRVIDDMLRIKDEVGSERSGLEGRRKELEMQKDPINWLPPELLIHIFLDLTDLDVEDVRHRPPLVLSHVCSRWRTAVISTPQLWSRIILQGFKNEEVVRLFLSRSKDTPLEVDYSSLADSMPASEYSQARDFILMFSQHFNRCVDLSFRPNTAKAVDYFLPFLNDFNSTFPRLRRLNLSIMGSSPSYSEAPLLLSRAEMGAGRREASTSPNPCHLKHLIIGQIPPLNFEGPFISHLRKLELSFPPKKSSSSRYSYELKLSSLCALLLLTPLLEELVLNNTVPFLNILLVVPNQNVATSASFPLNQLRLEYLKSIEWSYPSTLDVLHLLCFLDLPMLERLDLWIEHPHLKRDMEWRMLGAPSHELAPCFPLLRDVSIQCNGDETMVCALRKFSLPALEKVAFTNVDTAARAHDGEQGRPLPVFPRLESVFHDPRLPHLTHLTLSHFKISPESGSGEAVLGYMPLLTSLSLDSCIGVGILLSALKERLVVGFVSHSAAADENRPRRGVKLCPRLEALSIRSCQDVAYDSLRRVVLARNGISKDSCTQDSGSDTASVDVCPNGENAGSITREEVLEGESREGSQSGSSEVANKVQTVRKVKPLKLRHAALGAGLPSALPSNPTTMVSTLIAMREVLEPANIIYIRIADCKLVTQEQAMSFRNLGVLDVIWAGSA